MSSRYTWAIPVVLLGVWRYLGTQTEVVRAFYLYIVKQTN